VFPAAVNRDDEAILTHHAARQVHERSVLSNVAVGAARTTGGHVLDHGFRGAQYLASLSVEPHRT
jgi:hypothetical protein